MYYSVIKGSRPQKSMFGAWWLKEVTATLTGVSVVYLQYKMVRDWLNSVRLRKTGNIPTFPSHQLLMWAVSAQRAAQADVHFAMCAHDCLCSQAHMASFAGSEFNTES